MAKKPTPETSSATGMLPKPKYDWPESTEKRCLRCDVSPKEATDYGREQSELIKEIDRLEEAKKASASQYKAQIDEKGARARRLAAYITDGWQEKDVQCEWWFECAGIDNQTGERIYHPEKKALVRMDTYEVVEVLEITNDERQMSLMGES